MREEILAKVREYYEQEWGNREFVPGEDSVPVSGRVFDAEELVALVDSSLDFWLTTGRWAHQLERKLTSVEIAALHLRASDWYAGHGHPEDALEHALAAGALDRATELISAHGMPRLMAADAGTVIRWIRALPLEWLDRRPELRLTYAWALVAQLELKEAETQVLVGSVCARSAQRAAHR